MFSIQHAKTSTGSKDQKHLLPRVLQMAITYTDGDNWKSLARLEALERWGEERG